MEILKAKISEREDAVSLQETRLRKILKNAEAKKIQEQKALQIMTNAMKVFPGSTSAAPGA